MNKKQFLWKNKRSNITRKDYFIEDGLINNLDESLSGYIIQP
ncbi:hypothetical protein J2R98_000164 [Alkalibacillus filiformis]|uniref:Uncharacterized protein n=1 Tax=Alkalibacillus filiformis TaxID=200990 RepID=A0ABU0DPH9_9BACI|nr:hypothetical protein [Alkalibacillus filiformis]